LPVLFDIVKRRFVRIPMETLVCRGETLNLPHMMGLPNRTLEPISRSWSFCADGIKQPARVVRWRQSLRDCAWRDNPFGIAR